MEDSAAGDEGEPKQRGILFEYVSLLDCEGVRVLIVNCSELLKESRASYSPYQNVLARLITRKTKKTCRPYVGSRRTSGTPSSSTRSVQSSNHPPAPQLRQSAASPTEGVVQSKLQTDCKPLANTFDRTSGVNPLSQDAGWKSFFFVLTHTHGLPDS